MTCQQGPNWDELKHLQEVHIAQVAFLQRLTLKAYSYYLRLWYAWRKNRHLPVHVCEGQVAPNFVTAQTICV